MKKATNSTPIKKIRHSSMVYTNKFYKDGKPRIVMMYDDKGFLVFKDQPYGYNKNRQMIKIKNR